jgi:hypothetical protein
VGVDRYVWTGMCGPVCVDRYVCASSTERPEEAFAYLVIKFCWYVYVY